MCTHLPSHRLPRHLSQQFTRHPSHQCTHLPSHQTPKPPTYPTPKPPTYPSSPPAKPPTYPKPTRSHVAVQGVVYCKSCKYAGVDTLLGAKPVIGATVRLACKDTKNELTVQFKTDKNGYFFLQAPYTISNFSIRKCSISLVSSPLKSCSVKK
ncbi:arabinogalactan protein 30 [Hibiscus trionum]|uniref:Arabinogalactan protein 30 n=1 Tax=Hibiscus trionum TaxID=183268 RepID=A0A9W7I6T8_HIBTR|nr:arabinogalactan protein 30 [Hibiscus trionum]